MSGFLLDASSGFNDSLSTSVEVLHFQPILQIFRELGDEDILLGMLASELSYVCHLIWKRQFNSFKIFSDLRDLKAFGSLGLFRLTSCTHDVDI